MSARSVPSMVIDSSVTDVFTGGNLRYARFYAVSSVGGRHTRS